MAEHPWASHDYVKEVGIKPSINGDIVQVHSDAVGATLTLHTVSAGKTLLLFSWEASLRVLAACPNDFQYYMRGYTSAAAVKYEFVNGFTQNDQNHHITQNYFIPLVFDAGDYINIATNHYNLGLAVNIFGIEI